MLASFFLFNSIWSILGWTLFLFIFFTVIGMYRMNIQQVQTTQKRINNNESISQSINRSINPSMSVNELPMIDSAFESEEEEKEQELIEQEDRENNRSINQSINDSSKNRASNQRRIHSARSNAASSSTSRTHSRYQSQPMEIEAFNHSTRERERPNHPTSSFRDRERERERDRSRSSKPASNQSTNIREREVKRSKPSISRPRVWPIEDEHLREPRAHEEGELDLVDAVSDAGTQTPDAHVDLDVESRSLEDDSLEVESVESHVELRPSSSSPSNDLQSDIHSPITESNSNSELARIRHIHAQFFAPVLLPTCTLSVYFEFSRLIREAWLQGVLRQQKFMLLQLIERERRLDKLSDVYAAVLKRLMAYYEPERPPDENPVSVDVFSVWQHELGDRKLEESIDLNGQIVAWMCDLIKKVASASASNEFQSPSCMRRIHPTNCAISRAQLLNVPRVCSQSSISPFLRLLQVQSTTSCCSSFLSRRPPFRFHQYQ